jgi:hypothetical protein
VLVLLLQLLLMDACGRVGARELGERLLLTALHLCLVDARVRRGNVRAALRPLCAPLRRRPCLGRRVSTPSLRLARVSVRGRDVRVHVLMFVVAIRVVSFSWRLVVRTVDDRALETRSGCIITLCTPMRDEHTSARP